MLQKFYYQDKQDKDIFFELYTAAVLGGFLYVAGGEPTNDQRSPVNTAFRYDPRNHTWLQIANMKNKRESFNLGVLNNMLYAVGKLIQ